MNDISDHPSPRSLKKADFDNVHHTMKASVSGAINLPANLRAQIAKGVTNGITEAESNGHCSKLSEMDRDTFTKIILGTITTQTTAGAPDTDIHAKLMAQMPDTAADNRLIAVVNGTNIVEIKSSSANIILNIVHQASVNIMEGRDSRYLGEAISVLLEAYFSNDWFKGSVRLSTASLLDRGDVKVVADAEHREDLDRLIQSTAWHEEVEEKSGSLAKTNL
ncbi:hypothetical protein HO173_006449 [Letharia columbiana]|uniref:Uncharacterized protein n=1 Tax=Letharia columbiana TaxID=112416 RepID=A0A8H6FV02_9LECA|nr:uncharacterized protein HO173_006449 [Letharia columbiana]KAF6235255.1 hypothetical protein HO173_006449 [Letharia columbiana]